VLSGGGLSVLNGGGRARKKQEEKSLYLYATFLETLNKKLAEGN
jgi:hypothetical protein